jgi:hypothetical protein
VRSYTNLQIKSKIFYFASFFPKYFFEIEGELKAILQSLLSFIKLQLTKLFFEFPLTQENVLESLLISKLKVFLESTISNRLIQNPYTSQKLYLGDIQHHHKVYIITLRYISTSKPKWKGITRKAIKFGQ